MIAKREGGQDPLVDAFLQEPLPPSYRYCLTILHNPALKTYLEAGLLTEADLARIAEVIELPLEVVEIYCMTFYPVRSLSRIEKLFLVETCESDTEKNLKRWAVTQGFDFLAWRMGAKVEISPVDGMSSLYADCYFKAKEAFFNSNSAEASKEALKWAKQAAEISRVLKAWVTNNKEAMKDIEIALDSLTEDDVQFGNIQQIADDNGEEILEEVKIDFGDIDDLNSSNKD